MTAADVYAFVIGRDDGERDADILALAEEVARIEQAEGDADQRRVGSERDIALVPRQADAQRLPALVALLHDRADVAHGGGIRARGRSGEGEAGDLVALGEPRQVIVLLLLGAVLLDELARPKRVGHHDDRDDVRRARGDLAEDQRLRLGREAQAAVLLGDQHAEEAMALDERPDLLRDLALVVAHLPIVDHPAELIGRPVEERLLLFRERDGRDRAQSGPIGAAGKKLRVEADRAGVERLLLGGGHPGQDLLDHAEGRRHQHGAADVGHGQQCERDRRQPGNEAQPAEGRARVAGRDPRQPAERDGRDDGSPHPQRRLAHGERENQRHAHKNEYQFRHRSAPPLAAFIQTY